MKEKPNIFNYADYRNFLKDTYDFMKASKKSFSYRYFAKKAGFGSPNTLKMVMHGERNLTASSIKKFSKALALNNQEAEYFEALVFFNQSIDSEEKSKYYGLMTKSRRYRQINYLDKDIYEFYSHWYHVTIREMVLMPKFQEDPKWIAKRVFPSISPTQAQNALDLLLKLGFLKRDERGALRQADPIVSTKSEVRSLAVTNFHKQMIDLAEKSLTHVKSPDRDITSVTIGMTKEQMPLIKKKIEEFRLELITTIASEIDDPEAIYQLNIQFFPTTSLREK